MMTGQDFGAGGSHPEGKMIERVEERVLAFIERGAGKFEDLILELHAVQRQLCPVYGSFCSLAKKDVTTWKDIPAIPLTAFRDQAIRCFPASETTQTFRTSGTTGEGYGEHHLRTLTLYRAAALGGWDRAGLAQNPVLCLLPRPEETPHSSLSRMAAWLAREENFFHGDWEKLHSHLASSHSTTSPGEPLTVFGTALGFWDFFEWLGSQTLVLPPGSIAVETGGYKGSLRQLSKPELHRHFEDRLGLPSPSVWNEYGMTEMSSQFYTAGMNAPHTGAPWVRALVIDPETGQECNEGETGILRIFDLANTGSCCALETRDLAIRHHDGFELLGRDPAALARGCSRRADEILLEVSKEDAPRG